MRRKAVWIGIVLLFVASPSFAQTGLFTGTETVDGLLKTCWYDSPSGRFAQTVGAVELCPMSVDRDEHKTHQPRGYNFTSPGADAAEALAASLARSRAERRAERLAKREAAKVDAEIELLKAQTKALETPEAAAAPTPTPAVRSNADYRAIAAVCGEQNGVNGACWEREVTKRDAAVAPVASSAAAPDTNDGNVLLKNCVTANIVINEGKVPEGDPEWMIHGTRCVQYIAGIADAEELHRQAFHEAKYCVPEAVINSQKVQVVLKYLRANPATLHDNAAVLIFLAFKEAFPCDAKGDPK